ncbi:hypothetical protein [Ideonella sp.]|jgi:hypothetical protein|uniref:hypothetical protein n=1 Tax=Ideonella sp. TaxID=1929293 RepID=UPI0037BE2B00
MQAPRDVAAIRLENALSLFDEFVRLTAKHADAATLRGLEGRFAERLQIQPSYWSQIKGRSRQIGERLARQFEQCCHKPAGWMDQVHSTPPNTATAEAQEAPPLPQDDDERFIVGLVLTYYRRHPARAKKALLNLLGDVLEAPGKEVPLASTTRAGTARSAATGTAVGPAAAPAPDVDQALWQQMQRGIAPLKSKR